MSQALSTLSFSHGFRLTGRMQTQMLMTSLDASPCLDLLKKGDSPCSLHASHMLSTNPLLICTKSLYAVDKRCSFLAFALQGDKRPTGNHRMQAKAHEDDDVEDEWDYLETDFQTSFLDVSNGGPKAQEKRNHKYIKANAVGESEVVTSHLKSDSKPNEDKHDKGQSVKMPDTADRIIEIIRRNKLSSNAAPSRNVVSKVKYSNSKPPFKTFNAQDSNGKPPDKKYAQSLARNRNSKPTYPSQDKSSIDFILDVLGQFPPQEHIEKTTSPITAPVVKQQEQEMSLSFQPENNGFADDPLNVGHYNEKQHKSVAQHAASHVLDTSNITSVEAGENESPMKDNALQIDSSHVLDTSSVTSVKAGENEYPMKDNALQIDSSHIQKVDPSTLKLSDLRIMAKTHGLKGYYRLKKAELLELLKNSQLDDSSMYQ